MLQAILFDLGLPYQGLTEQVARLAVTDSCLDFYREGGKTLIVVDEAHHLAADVLEELRLLSNLEGKDGKAVQVLLVALPVIEETLDKPALAAPAAAADGPGPAGAARPRRVGRATCGTRSTAAGGSRTSCSARTCSTSWPTPAAACRGS